MRDAIVVAAAGAAHEAEARRVCARLCEAGLPARMLEGGGILSRSLVQVCAAGAAAVWMVGRPEIEPGWIWMVDRGGGAKALPLAKAIARWRGPPPP